RGRFRSSLRVTGIEAEPPAPVRRHDGFYMSAAYVRQWRTWRTPSSAAQVPWSGARPGASGCETQALDIVRRRPDLPKHCRDAGHAHGSRGARGPARLVMRGTPLKSCPRPARICDVRHAWEFLKSPRPNRFFDGRQGPGRVSPMRVQHLLSRPGGWGIAAEAAGRAWASPYAASMPSSRLDYELAGAAQAAGDHRHRQHGAHDRHEEQRREGLTADESLIEQHVDEDDHDEALALQQPPDDGGLAPSPAQNPSGDGRADELAAELHE